MTRLAAHQLPPSRIRDALRAGGLDHLPDADLLDRFARYGEHEAFESLLRRHGPMVFGVCRRVLTNAADTDDAFQATFLVFVRKARSLIRGDRLGPWLYGVAVRVAMKARSRAARLAARRIEATDMIPDPTTAEFPDWLPILDAELQALPAKYREPLVLCELQGASRADAAKLLGIPEGTLSSRLARGRELLRKRLLKHGTLLPAGGLTTLFIASGIGRATVPATLLAKTSDVVAISTPGAVLAGAVPAGAARLTDEVLKGMFITKLRVASGAILAAGLVAVGLLAAWPGEAPGQPDKPKATAKVADAKPQLAKGSPAGTKLPDRDALQGLWVLEKMDLGQALGKALRGEEHQLKEMIGKMRFLVAGDMWWAMVARGQEAVMPQVAKLDPTKNPKWLDLRVVTLNGSDLSKCIYELEGDKLRICVSHAGNEVRPAEFNTEEDDTLLMVMEYRREKLPPAAGDKALVGSWLEGEGRRPDGAAAPMRVEILDGYLFAFPSDKGNAGRWLGGKYTVDTTKNPKWIDVEMAAPGNDKATKLYGCYEIADGQLKLALGTTGKRVTRPLELMTASDVLYFEVKPTKEPLAAAEKIVREGVTRPSQRHLDTPNAAPPPTLKVPEPPAKTPRPKNLPGWDEQVRDLMKAGKFAEAESLLENRLSVLTGVEAAESRLQYAVCMLERTHTMEAAKATKLRQDAGENFRVVIQLAGEHEKAGGPAGKRATWVRTQAEIRLLQVFHQVGKPDELLTAASPLWEKHHKTAEGLIVLSLMYHAFKQKGDTKQAQEARDVMKELFDKLKDKPDAFPAKTGEFSREYWEKVWFAEK